VKAYTDRIIAETDVPDLDKPGGRIDLHARGTALTNFPYSLLYRWNQGLPTSGMNPVLDPLPVTAVAQQAHAIIFANLGSGPVRIRHDTFPWTTGFGPSSVFSSFAETLIPLIAVDQTRPRHRIIAEQRPQAAQQLVPWTQDYNDPLKNAHWIDVDVITNFTQMTIDGTPYDANAIEMMRRYSQAFLGTNSGAAWNAALAAQLSMSFLTPRTFGINYSAVASPIITAILDVADTKKK